MSASIWQPFMVPLTKKRRFQIDVVDLDQVNAEANTLSVNAEARLIAEAWRRAMPISEKFSKMVLTF
jgi:hypothetical protein